MSERKLTPEREARNRRWGFAEKTSAYDGFEEATVNDQSTAAAQHLPPIDKLDKVGLELIRHVRNNVSSIKARKLADELDQLLLARASRQSGAAPSTAPTFTEIADKIEHTIWFREIDVVETDHRRLITQIANYLRSLDVATPAPPVAPTEEGIMQTELQRSIHALCPDCKASHVLDNGRVWYYCGASRLIGVAYPYFSEKEIADSIRAAFAASRQRAGQEGK